ncbi:MAG: hypothetical protein O3C45_02745 [Bacteroidetes bacterium]|nr:hypothetical protein [Bacteroidota bacterium]MDA0873959.1 hypothetical protein [Bacteroidota bacterium]
MSRRRPALRLLPFLLLLVLVSTGCEDAVNPFVEEDRYFTLFGYLDTANDEQFVRVIPLRTDFAASEDTSIDATVTTLEVESGRTIVWADSVITFADGSVGHVFHAPFRPIPGWTYELNVTRADGKQVRASTTIPIFTGVELDAPIISTSFVFQKIRWTDIDFKPFRVEVWYRFLNSSPGLPFLEAVIPYGNVSEEYGKLVEGNKWEVLVQLTKDKEDVTEALGLSENARPFLMSVGMRFTMTSDSWRPPDGVFDEEVLVQPGTFSNVDGGFGFFGSVNQYTYEWTLSPEITSLAGYSFPN